VFISVFTLAGLLRPGYSPIRQAVSDLGAGPGGWLLDGTLVVTGLLLMAFAVGFAWRMRPVLTPNWRRSSAALLALHGLGVALAGVFTEAPETLVMHKRAATAVFFAPVVAFLIAGLALRRDPRWRGWGRALLAAAALTLVVIANFDWRPKRHSCHLSCFLLRPSVPDLQA
jgi:hypothetical membrane protein